MLTRYISESKPQQQRKKWLMLNTIQVPRRKVREKGTRKREGREGDSPRGAGHMSVGKEPQNQECISHGGEFYLEEK